MKNEKNLLSGLLAHVKNFSVAKGIQSYQKNRKRNRLRSLIVEQLEGRRLMASVDLASLGAGVTISGAAVDDSSGFSVSSAGDVNGDGYDDVIIGAKLADRTTGDPAPEPVNLAGKSYVVFGGPSLSATIDLASLGSNGFRILGANANDYSGFTVSAIGDVNGDGKDDLAVSSPFADVNYQENIGTVEVPVMASRSRESAGEVHIVFGSNSLANATIDLNALGANGFRILGADIFDQTGLSVTGAGDFNGDGIDDIAIGAPEAAGLGNLKASAGDSYIVYGTTTTHNTTFGLTTLTNTLDLLTLGAKGVKIHGADVDDRSGDSISLAGDLNGDGFDDLVIGAAGAEGLGPMKQLAGQAFVLFGGKSVASVVSLSTLGTPSGAAGSKIYGANAYDGLGYSLSVAGDVNGDGIDDLLVGARFATVSGDSSAGKSYLLFGSASLAASIDLASAFSGTTFLGVDAGDESGASVRGAGDVNGDGYNDLILSAPYADASGGSKSNAGESYLLFGGTMLPPSVDLDTVASAVSPVIGVTIWGATNDDKSGTSIDSAGDVNGDGFDDLIIGAPSADAVTPARAGAGESYIVYGGNGFTLSVTNLGTSAGESLSGSASIDIIVGGGGNDGLAGNGGADVLIGGQGNDFLVVSSMDFRRLVGGTGNDTLMIDAGGLTLNLSALADNRIQGVEEIDLTGLGNNSLFLNQRDVLNLSDESNTLVIRGNAGDKVSTLGWTLTGSEAIGPNFFNVYTQGKAVLKVQETITFQAGLDLASLTTPEGTTIVGSAIDDLSGFSVSNAGDINGDGYEDIILGAHQADPSALNNAGASYIIFGSASPIATINLASANIKILGAAAGNLTGQSVSGAGDVNGDGYDDFIVGAPGESSSAGKSYVFFGSPLPAATIDLATTPANITILGAAAGEMSGVSVSSAGDVDGDGYGDLLVGADTATTTNGASSGRTTLIYGSMTPPSTINLGSIGANGFSIIGGAVNDNSGRSVSAAGDLNRDGLDDIVIGAENADDGANADAGKTYVIFGNAIRPAGPIDLATLSLPTGIIFTGEAAGDLSGTSVSNAGDIDGDGYEDLIIGARASDPSGRTDAGKTYVVFGGPSLGSINLSALGMGGFSILGATVGNATGVSVSVAGDVNGDGYDDLIIGADLANPGSRTDAGESYLLFGSSTRPSSSIDLSALSNGLVIIGSANDDRSGHSVSGAGDVNGDGYDDLLIGAFQADDGANANVGKAYIIYGRNFTDSVTHAGSSAANTIDGTSAANIMVAGGGNDSVAGNGGLDVIIGGQGDDIITVTSTIFRRIDGGTGSDTLRFDGAGMALDLTDLTLLSNAKIFDIETIDMTGSGDNSVTLNVNAVRNLSSTTNKLVVRKNTGDIVNRGLGWTQGANQLVGTETFEVFTQGSATLWVQFFAQPSITVTATSRVYDGTVFVATSNLTGSIAPTPTVSYEYFLDPSGLVPISAPKNVGEYYVRAVSAANGSNAAAISPPIVVDPLAVPPLTSLVGFSITAKALTATGGVGVNRVYNGLTSAQVTRTLTGVVAGDTVVGTSTGTFATAAGGKNVGVNKQITSVSSTVTLSGPDAANYTVGTSNTTNRNATVTAKPITGTAVAANRFYDGTSTATIVISLQDFVSGDIVSATGTGLFTDANVGDLKPVTVSGVALGGTDASNYTLSPVANTVATISKKLLSATASANNKVYDGATTATISYTNLAGFVGLETVTVLTAAGTFDTRHVGTNKVVTASAPVLQNGDNGGLAANYSLPTPTGLTAEVTPKALTVTASTAANRVYNGLLNATVTVSNAQLSGIVGGDTLVTGTATGTFDNKNVGTGKTVTVGTVTLAGTNSTNYTVGAAPNTTANITAKAITTGNVVSRTGQNKQYDGTNVATVVIGFSAGVVIAGDDFLATAARAFSSSAVGVNKTITALSNTVITRSGADANNYTVANLTGAVTNADITQKLLTATGTATNKVYDANTNASVSIVLNGIVGIENVTGTASGAFDTKNVGTGKTVTIGAITLSGTNAGNYTVGSAPNTNADITAKAITGSITAANKVFDGNTSATILTRTLSGVESGDTVSYVGGTATFNTAAVGNGKTVTATGLSLSGADAGNYTVNTSAQTTANITAPADTTPPTVTGIFARRRL
jgi:YDG domain/FG-GAP repeat/RTX calcium-binding nonapeptide repeat (4 copies)